MNNICESCLLNAIFVAKCKIIGSTIFECQYRTKGMKK